MDENEILLKEIIDANQNVQDALILLKIWLSQRNLKVNTMFIHDICTVYVIFLIICVFIFILGKWKYFKLCIIHVCGVLV